MIRKTLPYKPYLKSSLLIHVVLASFSDGIKEGLPKHTKDIGPLFVGAGVAEVALDVSDAEAIRDQGSAQSRRKDQRGTSRYEGGFRVECKSIVSQIGTLIPT